MTIYLREYWHDPRMRFEHLMPKAKGNITLTGADIDEIWIPDLFFVNSKEAHMHTVTVANRLMKVTPDGRVTYSSRFGTVFDQFFSPFPQKRKA